MWESNIAMENARFIDEFPVQNSIHVIYREYIHVIFIRTNVYLLYIYIHGSNLVMINITPISVDDGIIMNPPIAQGAIRIGHRVPSENMNWIAIQYILSYIYVYIYIFNGLVKGNNYRKPSIFPLNMGLSRKFSLKPIR